MKLTIPEYMGVALRHFRLKYHYSPQDIVRSDSKGYWKVKEPCPGGDQCKHSFRSALGSCSGGKELTVYYAEHGVRDHRGRFIKPFRVWEDWNKFFGRENA